MPNSGYKVFGEMNVSFYAVVKPNSPNPLVESLIRGVGSPESIMAVYDYYGNKVADLTVVDFMLKVEEDPEEAC